jgi:hypothetical protein
MALQDGAFAFDIGGTGFKPCDVGLAKLKLGGVLNGDNSFR